MDNYKTFLNQVIGFISVSLALGTLSTDNPKFFAFVFLIVMVVYLIVEASKFFSRNEKPSRKQIIKELPEYVPYFAGLFFLFFVVVGWIDKTGWVG